MTGLCTILLPGLLAALGPGTPHTRPVQSPPQPRASDWLTLLPEGETKRQFILDCTGCHQFDNTVLRPNGQPRARADWEAAVTRMLGFAGATTGFPVIGHQRSPAPTAEWLAAHTGGTPEVRSRPALPAGTTITEYDLPNPQDLAHDVAVDPDGKVIVTGMFSHEMLVLDTVSRSFSSVAIPVPRANPRSVDIDQRGNWWVVLGAPNAVAMYSPLTGRWMTSAVGMYAHSVAIDRDGNAWANGHFTKDPVRVTRVTPAGEMTSFDLPRHPVLSSAPGGPIPYEIRVAPNGVVWMSELAGNRIVRLDPATRETRAYDLPMTHGGPRRLDVGPDGVVWIPAYAANELLRFDPASGAFQRFTLPIADALPYVARVDGRGRVWVGSGSADAVFLFDPATRGFTTFTLPSRGAMIRHMAIDSRNGDVWLAYGASPGRIPSRIARLRVTM